MPARRASQSSLSGVVFPGPDTPPFVPSAYDYEFDATSSSLPTGWSWVNQGTATYSEALGSGSFAIPSGSSTPRNVRGMVRSVPSESTWTAQAKIAHNHRGTGTGLQLFGVSLREAATSKAYHFFMRVSANIPAANVLYFTDDNTLSSEPVSTVGTSLGAGTSHFRLVKNSATSYDFWVSTDGVGWVSIATAFNPSAFTADQIGILGWTENNNAMAYSAEHFRVRL